MAEYITKAEALRAVEDAVELFQSEYDEVAEKINNIPAADVAPVVRCKDCKHSYECIGGVVCSHGICVDCIVPPDFYCAEGKRRETSE